VASRADEPALQRGKQFVVAVSFSGGEGGGNEVPAVEVVLFAGVRCGAAQGGADAGIGGRPFGALRLGEEEAERAHGSQSAVVAGGVARPLITEHALFVHDGSQPGETAAEVRDDVIPAALAGEEKDVHLPDGDRSVGLAIQSLEISPSAVCLLAVANKAQGTGDGVFQARSVTEAVGFEGGEGGQTLVVHAACGDRAKRTVCPLLREQIVEPFFNGGFMWRGVETFLVFQKGQKRHPGETDLIFLLSAPADGSHAPDGSWADASQPSACRMASVLDSEARAAEEPWREWIQAVGTIRYARDDAQRTRRRARRAERPPPVRR